MIYAPEVQASAIMCQLVLEASHCWGIKMDIPWYTPVITEYSLSRYWIIKPSILWRHSLAYRSYYGYFTNVMIFSIQPIQPIQTSMSWHSLWSTQFFSHKKRWKITISMGKLPFLMDTTTINGHGFNSKLLVITLEAIMAFQSFHLRWPCSHSIRPSFRIFPPVVWDSLPGKFFHLECRWHSGIPEFKLIYKLFYNRTCDN